MKALLLFSLALVLFARPLWAEDKPAAPYAGTFSTDRFKLELKSADGQNYVGTITMGDNRFPLTGRAQRDSLTGSFESQGNRFDFIARQTGEGLTFKTGNSDYTLKRQFANPLDANQAVANAAKPAGAASPTVAGGGLGGLAGATGVGPVSDSPKPTGADAAKPTASGKDALAYRVQQINGGTIAVFDGWKVAPLNLGANIIAASTFPEGRQSDYILSAAIATPSKQDLENFFTVGPQLTRQLLAQLSPTFRATGQGKKTKVGGDEALIEEYEGQINGKKVTARVIYVRRQDVGFAVSGIGTEAGMSEFSRSIEIVAQSITFKEAALEPALVGTFFRTLYHGGGDLNVSNTRSITIYPNGTFTDSANTLVTGAVKAGQSQTDVNGLVEGAHRGRVIKRGNNLTFHYDNGQTWSAPYEVYSNGMKLDGQLYERQ
jgi:hypothetical protein